MKKVILIDLDMTIADFHSTFMDIWAKKYPDRKLIAINKRKHFKLTDEYPQKFKDDIKGDNHATGVFCRNDTYKQCNQWY
jgi:hypothetical protein